MTREDVVEAVLSKAFKTRLKHPLKASRHGEIYDTVHGKSRVYGVPTPIGTFGSISLRSWRGPGKRPGPRIITKSGRNYEQHRKKYVTKAIKREVKAKKVGKTHHKWQYHKKLDKYEEILERFRQENPVGGSRKLADYAAVANHDNPSTKAIHRHMRKNPGHYKHRLGKMSAHVDGRTKSIGIRQEAKEHPIDRWAKAKGKGLNKVVGNQKRKSTFAAKRLGKVSAHVAAKVGKDTLWQRLVHEEVSRRSRAELQQSLGRGASKPKTRMGKDNASKAIRPLTRGQFKTNRRQVRIKQRKARSDKFKSEVKSRFGDTTHRVMWSDKHKSVTTVDKAGNKGSRRVMQA